MESPFIEGPIISKVNYEEFSDFLFETLEKSPLIAPEDLTVDDKPFVSSEEPINTYEWHDAELVEGQVPPAIATIKIGDVSFSIAADVKSLSEEYKEPVSSGNPLLFISPRERQLNISKNFKVDEYARAQAGAHKFDYVRFDPSLVENVQKLRSFCGKPMKIIDGYYSPKYLKSVLKQSDPVRISLNPHITGRSVKLEIPGFNGMIKQIAIACIVSCGRDIHIGIGSGTMTLAVKQQLLTGPETLQPDFQRIRSYLADERLKMATIYFCVDFKRVLYDYTSEYMQYMHKGLSSLVVFILKTHYSTTNISPEWFDWEKPIRDAISIMHDKSITKEPNVILYCLAYSPFGNLYRFYLKDKSNLKSDTVSSIVNDLTTDQDRKLSQTPGNFIPSQNKADKTDFIKTCRQRINIGKKADGSLYNLSPVTFFDWKDNEHDKNFLGTISAIIKDVYFINKYAYDIPVQQLPVGGTRSNLKLTAANPDKPVVDYTGRYWAEFDPGHPTLFGGYLLINQAGNYVAGKMGDIYKKEIKSLRNTISEFYGKIDEKGNAICNLYPQQTMILKKGPNETRMYIVDNPTDKIIQEFPLKSRSKNPVISNRIINSFTSISKNHEDLMLTLAWAHPLPDQLKVFYESFKKSEPDVKEAIRQYYGVDEPRPSIRESKLRRFISDLDSAIINHLRLPPMFNRFAVYYTKYYYSVSGKWSPGKDKETRSVLDWIKKMLEDYRDLKGKSNIEKNWKSLYSYFDIDTTVPDVLYTYVVKLSLRSFGFGPFARSSGTITIENKTDYNKYPKAKKWISSKNSEDYPVTLWNATLSLNPGKWLPKIGAGQNIEASIKTNALYYASDFSKADIQITEGKVFEIPIGGSTGGVKGTTKIGLGSVVILIDGRGKRTLEFTQDLQLSPPDSIEIEPSVSSAKEGTFEKIAGFLPSLTMYKGTIGSKITSVDVVTVPLAESFGSTYQIQSTKYFRHDDAELSPQALEAIGRLCSEELVAFSDPNSKVEIYGHTDASGNPDHNLKLSTARAKNTETAINDRLVNKLKANIVKVAGLGEEEANKKFGQYTQKNAWLRRVVIIINGRAVLSLGEL